LWNKRTHSYFPVPCKKWTCKYCSPKKKLELLNRIKRGKIGQWPIKTHTILTVADEETNKNIDRCFNNLMTLIRRGVYARVIDWEGKVGTREVNSKVVIVDRNKHNIRKGDRLIKRENLKYYWQKEFQGERFQHEGKWYRHLHVIFNQVITKYDIIPIWNHVTKRDFNYVEHRKVYNWDNGFYLAKYLTDVEFQEQFEPRERRYGSSKDVLAPIPKNKKEEKEQEWIFMRIETARALYEEYLKDPFYFDDRFDVDIYSIQRRKINEPIIEIMFNSGGYG